MVLAQFGHSVTRGTCTLRKHLAKGTLSDPGILGDLVDLLEH